MHEEFLELAEELIGEEGRDVVFIKLATLPGAFPGETAGDPRNPPASQLPTKACFVEPDSLQRLGHTSKLDELIKRSEHICLVPGTTDLEQFNELLDDDGLYYTITGMEKLRPGTRTLLYFVGVKR